MMPITLGGASLSQPSPKTLTHAGFGFFDAFITMGSRRNEAIALWLRLESLRDRLMGDPDGPKAMVIVDRITLLESKVMENQLGFLKAELLANGYWEMVREQIRMDEEWHEMIHMTCTAQTILALWRHPFSEVFPAPPKGCRMSNIVLQFATPAQIAAYSKGGTR